MIIRLGVTEDFRPQKKAHPAFLILELDKVSRKLENSGDEVKRDDALPNRRRFYSEDPFCNRLECI